MIFQYISEGFATLLAQAVRFRPRREGSMFIDLHVHLPRYPGNFRTQIENLEDRLDGYSVTSYGHDSDEFTVDYPTYVDRLYRLAGYEVESKGAVTILRRGSRKSIIFKAQEIDRTKQLVDISGIGINKQIDVSKIRDAREVIEEIHEQGGIAFLEHFCTRDTSSLTNKTLLERILPYVTENYRDKGLRRQLYEILDMVDAVEEFNGACSLYMIKQNILSGRTINEYEEQRKKKLTRIAGSDTHCDALSAGCAGVLIPKLDLSLTDREITEQLRENLKQGITIKGYPTLTSLMIQFIPSIRDGSSKFSRVMRKINRIHDKIRLKIS